MVGVKKMDKVYAVLMVMLVVGVIASFISWVNN